MTIVNIHEAKTNLSSLIQKALDGEEIIIAKNNEPVVTLKAIPKKKLNKKRVAGLYKDKINIIGNWEEGDMLVEKLLTESVLFPDEEDLD